MARALALELALAARRRRARGRSSASASPIVAACAHSAANSAQNTRAHVSASGSARCTARPRCRARRPARRARGGAAAARAAARARPCTAPAGRASRARRARTPARSTPRSKRAVVRDEHAARAAARASSGSTRLGRRRGVDHRLRDPGEALDAARRAAASTPTSELQRSCSSPPPTSTAPTSVSSQRSRGEPVRLRVDREELGGEQGRGRRARAWTRPSYAPRRTRCTDRVARRRYSWPAC